MCSLNLHISEEVYLRSKLKSEDPACVSVGICREMAALCGGRRLWWPGSTRAESSDTLGVVSMLYCQIF